MLEQPSSCGSRVLQTGPCPRQCWPSFAGSEWDSRPGEMSILAQFYYFAWQAVWCSAVTSHKHSGVALPSSVSAVRVETWLHFPHDTSVNTWVSCLHLLHSDICSNAGEQNISLLAIYGPMESCACHSCVYSLFSSFSALCENYISWMSGC